MNLYENIKNNIKESEDDIITCEWCGNKVDASECKKELNLGWICKDCQDTLYSRGEHATYDEYANYYDDITSMNESSYEDYYAKPIWFNNKKLYNEYKSIIEKQLRDGALDDPTYIETLSDEAFEALVTGTWLLDKENKEIFEDNCIKPYIDEYPEYAKYFDKNGVSIKESEEDTNSQWLVDTSGIILTNGGYHNNTEVLYGRVRMLPKDKNEIARNYDVIYIPENDWLEAYKPGTDVRSAVEYGYLYDGDHDNDWVKWNGQRVQIKDLPNLQDEVKESIPKDIEQELLSALSDLYFDKDKHRLVNKINYD